MLKVKLKGDFKNAEKFFDGAKTKLPNKVRSILDSYGRRGVEALRSSTPKDSGLTADSWSYKIFDLGIMWTNSKILTNGVPLAILIQYGHGTKNGGYVQGIDYINPAIQPILKEISENCWKEVQNL